MARVETIRDQQLAPPITGTKVQATCDEESFDVRRRKFESKDHYGVQAKRKPPKTPPKRDICKHIEDNVYRNALKHIRSKVMENIDVSLAFLNKILDADVITRDQFQRLKAMSGTDRADALLDILERQPVHTFPRFLQVLIDDGQQRIVTMLVSPRSPAGAENFYVSEPTTGAHRRFQAKANFIQRPSYYANSSEDMSSLTSTLSDLSDATLTGPIARPTDRTGKSEAFANRREQFGVGGGYRQTRMVDGRCLSAAAGKLAKGAANGGTKVRDPKPRNSRAKYATEVEKHRGETATRRRMEQGDVNECDADDSDDSYKDLDEEVYENVRTERETSVRGKRHSVHYSIGSVRCRRKESRRCSVLHRDSRMHQYQPLSTKSNVVCGTVSAAENFPPDLARVMIERQVILERKFEGCERKINELMDLMLRLLAKDSQLAENDEDLYTCIAPTDEGEECNTEAASEQKTNCIQGDHFTKQSESAIINASDKRNGAGSVSDNFGRIVPSKPIPCFGGKTERNVTTDKLNVADRTPFANNPSPIYDVPNRHSGAKTDRSIGGELQTYITKSDGRQNLVGQQCKMKRAGSGSEEPRPVVTSPESNQQTNAAKLTTTETSALFGSMRDPERNPLPWMRKPHSTSAAAQPNLISFTPLETERNHGSRRGEADHPPLPKASDQTGNSSNKSEESALKGRNPQNTASPSELKTPGNVGLSKVGNAAPVTTDPRGPPSVPPRLRPRAVVDVNINAAAAVAPSHTGAGQCSGSRPVVWAPTNDTTNKRASLLPEDW